MTDNRPNPDTLLRRFREEEASKSRGKLTIFFGYAPGVGKTHAMLHAAHAKKAQGVKVVIGIVETHGQPETAALLEGLETIPPLEVNQEHKTWKELDLDGALDRKPALLLVDDLAHVNAKGSRHLKRWQDVQELLLSGVNVYTTLNVQHLESLNDVVTRITGTIVWETLPDSVLEKADEVELVDLPAGDLLERLADGKVDVEGQESKAVQNFFQRGNLVALREMAFRMTADRLNDQVQAYRRDMALTQNWETQDHLLVCVGPTRASANLVRTAHRMAKALRIDWIAAYVETPEYVGDTEAESRAIQNLQLAEKLGGEAVLLSGLDVAEEVTDYAKTRKVTKILVGQPRKKNWRNFFKSSPVDVLLREGLEIDIYVAKWEASPVRKSPTQRSSTPFNWLGYGLAVIWAAACTALAWLVFPPEVKTNLDLANDAMIFLLGSLSLAAVQGFGPSVLFSLISVLCLDYYFVPPLFSIDVSDNRYILVFFVMLFVSLSISSLMLRVRTQARLSRDQERRTTFLYGLSRELASNRGTDDLLLVAIKHISEFFESSVLAFLPDEKGVLKARCGDVGDFSMTPKEMATAHWTYDLGQMAGRGTDTLPNAEALYLPLIATGAPVGVLAVKARHNAKPFLPEQLHLLEAFAHQTALAVSGDELAEKQQKTQLQMETEKLRSSLLSSVSHDLRTPLATIKGSIGGLLESGEQLGAETRRDFLENVHAEADRLERLVNNLLEMTRLESGAIQARKEPNYPEEVIGSAIARVEKRLGDRVLTTKIPAELPTVPMDGLLIEQVLVNLLDNALKYTPPAAAIEISTWIERGQWWVRVSDSGPGVKEEDLSRLFDKFYRGSQTGKTGAGLGLAICKGIIDIHGGILRADNLPEGGMYFEFSLPLENTDKKV
jgi:two-component system, OmpR family, sensor histidine kinase KdpD